MMPILFTLPFVNLPIYGYGIMLGVACVLGAHLAVYLSMRSGISERDAWKFAITVIVIGIVGGRVHDVWINTTTWAEFGSKMSQLQHEGRTAYGAFLSATLGAIVFARVYGVSFWRFADATAPTMALGLGIVRIGCFMAGCDYGVRSDTWGVCFPAGSPAWTDQLEAHPPLIPPTAARSLPVLPLQFAESAVGYAIFALCMVVWFRRPRREGAVLLTFFFTYGVCRALLEVFRADSGRGELVGLSTSMALGIGTAAIAAAAQYVPALARLRGDAGPVLPLPGAPPPEPAA